MKFNKIVFWVFLIVFIIFLYFNLGQISLKILIPSGLLIIPSKMVAVVCFFRDVIVKRISIA